VCCSGLNLKTEGPDKLMFRLCVLGGKAYKYRSTWFAVLHLASTNSDQTSVLLSSLTNTDK
jgi:hypothetical protein